MTLQDEIRRIAEEAANLLCADYLGNCSAKERNKIADIIRFAMKQAFRAFAKREPSEAMIDAAFTATVWPDMSQPTSSGTIKALRRNMCKEYVAMLAEAIKELE